MQLTKAQIGKVIAFDLTNRPETAAHRLSGRSKTYNLIVPHAKTKDPRKRDITVARVAVKYSKDGKPMVKVVEFTDLSTATKDGKVTIHYRDMGLHMIAGWIVYWDSDEFEFKNQSAWWCSAKFGEWAHEEYRFRCGLSAPFDQTVNPEDLADTRYRYCAFNEDDRRIGLLDYLMLYRADTRVELLSKAGLKALINPAGLKALSDRRVFEYVKTNLTEMREASEHCTVKEFLWCVKHDVSWKDAIGHFYFVTDLRRHLESTKQILDGKQKFSLDYERLRNAMPKWGVGNAEYARYLYEAVDAGLDIKCEGVLYPPVRDGRKTFMARLEKLEAENAKRHRREERERKKAEREAKAEEKERIRRTLASRMEELAAFQTGVDRVMELSGSGYRCVVARTQEELRAEGRRMNNCVGSGTYGRGIVLGNTIILQFKDANGRSWCDAEIDRSNWSLRQCYARGNTTAPDQVYEFAKTIAKQLKTMHIAHRKAKTFPILEKRKVPRKCA